MQDPKAKSTADRAERDVRDAADAAAKDAGQATERVKEKAGEVAADAADAARQFADQAKVEAGKAAEELKGRAAAAVGQQKTRLADELGSMSSAVRAAAGKLRDENDPNIASYTDLLADQIDSCSRLLRNTDLDNVMEKAEQFARRRPELFIGGLFVVGLGVARFLKASRPPRAAINGSSARPDSLPSTSVVAAPPATQPAGKVPPPSTVPPRP